MADRLDINLILDETCETPSITIRASEKSEQVERIIEAVEEISNAEHHGVPAYSDGILEFVPQRDIMRVRTEGRQIVLDTEDRYFIVKQTLKSLEQELKSDRFIRISQSEIINIYMVKQFDISLSGTIGIEFKNGVKTFASRRYISSVKNFLSERRAKNE